MFQHHLTLYVFKSQTHEKRSPDFRKIHMSQECGSVISKLLFVKLFFFLCDVDQTRPFPFSAKYFFLVFKDKIDIHLLLRLCLIFNLFFNHCYLKNYCHGDAVAMVTQLFYSYGHFCCRHPWEVIVTFSTLTICILSMEPTFGDRNRRCIWRCQCPPTETPDKDLDVVLVTVTRCMALLYVYHQFRKLYRLGSKYLIGIAGLFTVFSSVVYCSSILKFFKGNFSELNEAMPLFLLLVDLSKAALLAQFALSSASQEVCENIAKGMAVLGPAITLDTLVESLVIGVGTLSGIKKLEDMCCLAVLSALVNYVVFMTFFPACLSLVLELSKTRGESDHTWHLSHIRNTLEKEGEQKPNPVLLRVKVIMSAGLVLVHLHSHWPMMTKQCPVVEPHENIVDTSFPSISSLVDKNSTFEDFYRWFSVNQEQLVMAILASALAIKYIFFEHKEDIQEKIAEATCVRHSGELERNNSITNSTPSTPGLSFYRQTSYLTNIGSPTSPGCFQPYVSMSPGVSSFPTSPFYYRSFSFAVSEQEKHLINKEVQTDIVEDGKATSNSVVCLPVETRSVPDCIRILNSSEGPQKLTDQEILTLVEYKYIAPYKLESVLNNPERGVAIRRQLITKSSNCSNGLNDLPYEHYDYSLVMGACCENVIGYVPIPVGVAGPLVLDGQKYQVPMATTEGCLVASANRGCRALILSGGVRSYIVSDGMTRGPVVRLPTAQQAVTVMKWLQRKDNQEALKHSFDSSSRFARLQKLQVRVAGRYLFIRFVAGTGDAMGMNMISKGTELALKKLHKIFPDLEILSLSGNYCTDKKPSAVNWILGRGKCIVCEAEISQKVVTEVLKTTVQSLVDVNISKNLIGSAVAGSIGGFNAQAANIVSAIFIATGQDPAQNVDSSSCITLMEPSGPSGDNLLITCTMPSIETGTVGGGTVLPPQAACLDLLGVRGPSSTEPGQHAATLARIICGMVLAGELSLMSALAAGHLVSAHLKHNRHHVNEMTKQCSETM
ncbi:3-hydroxy-3-methylglutaryl-coenzyme A reductase-like isoform X2 [Tachypleus tridentatus]|uniref:3-hydroxy-3-methylglutaryl-coenzyme A reductase-like isoform X2 n=1 Tax=Tachypleus tridentatus TaxID=6853 RepID=UPI003FD62D53